MEFKTDALVPPNSARDFENPGWNHKKAPFSFENGAFRATKLK